MKAGYITRMLSGWDGLRVRTVFPAALAIAVSGCSMSASDVDIFGVFDEGPAATETAGQASVRERGDQVSTEAELEATPALSSVPPRPEAPTSPGVRQRVVEGLVADRANARYTDQEIRAQDTGAESDSTQQASRSETTTAPPPPPVSSPAQPSAEEPIPVRPTPLPQRDVPAQVAAGPPPAVRVDPSALDGGSAFPLTASRVTIDEQVATIHFAHSSSKLDERDRQVIAQVARAQKERGAEVVVIGHASGRTQQLDKIEHELANFRISLARANHVAEQLIAMGVPSEMVTVEARADDNRLYAESMPNGEAGNRRAEIFFRQ